MKHTTPFVRIGGVPALRLFALLTPIVFAAACRSERSQPSPPPEPIDPMVSVDTLLPEPDGFLDDHIDSDDFPIPPWARHLKGVKICLDPGHGGDADKRSFKRGPMGVREAEMNLRVAQYLKTLLEHAGAEVKLTRDADDDRTLKERADVANAWGADVFVSLHHNAFDKPTVNYTTVWYHADIDDHPANLDLARYLCDALYDDFPQTTFTEVPLKSDQLMYASGFGVLAAAHVTAALCESSFYTNPEEEQALRDPEHNFEEAYAMFMGLARYAHAGLPRVTLLSAQPDLLVFQLDDGLRSRHAWGWERNMIFSDSIVVRIDGERAEHAFTPGDYRLFVPLRTPLATGSHEARVQFMNLYKNSVLEPTCVIEAP